MKQDGAHPPPAPLLFSWFLGHSESVHASDSLHWLFLFLEDLPKLSSHWLLLSLQDSGERPAFLDHLNRFFILNIHPTPLPQHTHHFSSQYSVLLS